MAEIAEDENMTFRRAFMLNLARQTAADFLSGGDVLPLALSLLIAEALRVAR